MSRSNYDGDCGGWDLIRWRGAVASAIRGRRGQTMLRELAAAMDAMPVKELIAGELVAEGGVCAFGCLGQAKGITLDGTYETNVIAKAFGVSEALVRETVEVNDCCYNENPARRWTRVRQWVSEQIQKEIAR